MDILRAGAWWGYLSILLSDVSAEREKGWVGRNHTRRRMASTRQQRNGGRKEDG